MVSEDPGNDIANYGRGCAADRLDLPGRGCAADMLGSAWEGICSGNWICLGWNIGGVPVRSVCLWRIEEE